MRISAADLFKILGVETRIRIIALLKARGPLGTKAIAREIGITAAAVSQHLRVLKQAGLVSSERKGYWIPYSVDESGLGDCCGFLTAVCACGCSGKGLMGEVSMSQSTLSVLQGYAGTLREELGLVEQRIMKLKGVRRPRRRRA
jgi:DNA-binding transcriptional ArsR family regulator